MANPQKRPPTYYQQSHALLGLDSGDYDIDHWISEIGRRKSSVFALEHSGLENIVKQLRPPTLFGKAYRERLRLTPNVKTFLFANVTEVVPNKTATEATGV
jgi:hypothetical protein